MASKEQRSLTVRAEPDSGRAVHSPGKLLRVLFVSARYPPLIGGIEMHTYEVARRLAAQGHDITVLSTDRTGSFPPIETVDGVRILRVRAWPRNRDYYFAPGIFSVIMQGSWDIIHCQGYSTLTAPIAMIAALVSRTPYVLTFHSGGHSSSLRNRIRGLQRLLLRPLLRRSQRLVGVSEFETRLFRTTLHLPSAQFVVIPNGSHLEWGSIGESSKPTEPLILSIGRLERYKGHQRIIAAMPRILKSVPDARLRIAGHGPYESSLRALTSQLQIQDWVTIQGIESSDRVGMAQLLSDAALVTLFSDYEAHPVAIMEALSMKRPVLVTRTSGLEELVDHGLARAVPLDSTSEEIAEAVINAMRQPYHSPEFRLPTWDETAAELLKTYYSVLRKE